MPRGTPLTPEQLARAAEVYGATGNYSEAARALGVPTSTVTRALARAGEQKRATLHARAVARGVRKARRTMMRGLEVAGDLLDREKTDGAGMEPNAVAAIMNAVARHASALLDIQERHERARTQRATRERTRAETAKVHIEQEFWRKRVDGTLPPERRIVSQGADDAPLLSEADAAAILREEFGDTGALRAAAPPPPDDAPGTPPDADPA